NISMGVRATGSGSTGGSTVASGFLTPGILHKMVGAYDKATDKAYFAGDGVNHGAGSVSAWPASINALRFAGRAGFQNAPSGWIPLVRYYPRRLTDDQFRSLTR